MYRAPGIGDKPYALQGTPKTKDTHERVLQDVRSKTERYIREETLYVLRFRALLPLHAKAMVQPVLAFR